ncbi:MAG TPA: multiheme c-type cytochrome, partial [Gemmataceae bacterium]|nr:multiheme c-type cytochrome [Gemmataceae bacterium]
MRFCLVVAALAGTGVVAWYVFVRDEPMGQRAQPAPLENQPTSPDPRLAFATPFRNVRPDVQYVGDVTCTDCHVEIDKTYHAHPMGRSAEFVSKATRIERFDTAAHNPSTVGPYELLVERTGDAVLHRMRAKDGTGMALPDYVTRADLAIGSGTRGRSYLSLQQGAVWQTPISWYGYESRWDQSPGFDLGNGGRRGIVPDCLFCHVNRVDPVPESVNRYRDPFPIGQPAIGCERCHGPG